MSEQRLVSDDDANGAWQEFIAGGIWVMSGHKLTSFGRPFCFLVLPDDAASTLFSLRESIADEQLASQWAFRSQWRGIIHDGQRTCRLEVRTCSPAKHLLRILVPVKGYEKLLEQIAAGIELFIIREKTASNIGHGGSVLAEALPVHQGGSSAIRDLLDA
jgi:hypothetical protein